RRYSAVRWLPLVVLFIFSQPAFQIWPVYSMMLPYTLGIWASYAAFLVVQRSDGTSSSRVVSRTLLAAGLLMIGWLTFQASPFCGLALVVFDLVAVSEAEWPAQRRKAAMFVAALLGSMALFLAGYKTALALMPGADLYVLTRRSLSLLDGTAASSYSTLLE